MGTCIPNLTLTIIQALWTRTVCNMLSWLSANVENAGTIATFNKTVALEVHYFACTIVSTKCILMNPSFHNFKRPVIHKWVLLNCKNNLSIINKKNEFYLCLTSFTLWWFSFSGKNWDVIFLTLLSCLEWVDVSRNML